MRVAIVGGGYAGRMAMVRLRRAGVSVTLVDADAGWTERTRLHQAVATGRKVVFPFQPLVERVGAQFVQGRAVGFEPGGVALEDGQHLHCDRIVVATGLVPRTDAPGVTTHAHVLGASPAWTAARHRLLELPDGGRVVVVGAGLTGLEWVTEIAEAHPRLRCTLVGELQGLSPAGEQCVRRALTALQVEHIEGWAQAVRPDGVTTDDGIVGADFVGWATGFSAPPWIQRTGLPVDRDGRIQIDRALRVQGHPHVFAVGDCAASGLRPACATAMPMGTYAAKVLAREARGGPPPADFAFGFVSRFLSLGRRRALVQLTDVHDGPQRALGGWPAVAAKWTLPLQNLPPAAPVAAD